jgi:hypothetical protein
MLRCVLSERLLAVAAWLCVIGGVDLRAALLSFDGAGAMGVAVSIWLRFGCVSIGVILRFLVIAQSSASGNQKGARLSIALITRRSRAFQTSSPRIENAETTHYRSRGSSQFDTNHAIRLTGCFEFEQPPILLRGPLFVAVLGHGALTIENRSRIQHREGGTVPLTAIRGGRISLSKSDKPIFN